MLTSNSSMSYRNRGNLRYYVSKKNISNDINNTSNVSCDDYGSVYPDIKRPCKKRLNSHVQTYAGNDTMKKSIKCKQYGNMWLDFDRNNFQTVWSSIDRENFKKAIIVACEVMRSKDGSVSILGIRKMLKDSNIQIISYEVLSVIVKKWLVNNPNPKKSVARRNTVRHNNDSGQVCPCGDGILRMPDWWIKQALTPSW